MESDGAESEGESEGSDSYDWLEKVAVIGIGADGDRRVLVADITPIGVPVSEGAPNGPVLAMSGADASVPFRSALALLLVGSAVVLIVRRRDGLARR